MPNRLMDDIPEDAQIVKTTTRSSDDGTVEKIIAKWINRPVTTRPMMDVPNTQIPSGEQLFRRQAGTHERMRYNYARDFGISRDQKDFANRVIAPYDLASQRIADMRMLQQAGVNAANSAYLQGGYQGAMNAIGQGVNALGQIQSRRLQSQAEQYVADKQLEGEKVKAEAQHKIHTGVLPEGGFVAQGGSIAVSPRPQQQKGNVEGMDEKTLMSELTKYTTRRTITGALEPVKDEELEPQVLQYVTQLRKRLNEIHPFDLSSVQDPATLRRLADMYPERRGEIVRFGREKGWLK